MKRLLSLLLAMTFIFVFAGCEENTVENQKEPINQGSDVVENESTSQTPESNDTTLQGDDTSSQDTGDNPIATQTDEFISEAKAKEIALSDAGVNESQIRDYEIELDRERGVYYYEINFEAGGLEYEYDIDAKSGKIARKYKEKED